MDWMSYSRETHIRNLKLMKIPDFPEYVFLIAGAGLDIVYLKENRVLLKPDFSGGGVFLIPGGWIKCCVLEEYIPESLKYS